jgi:hypothetical protein
MEQLMTVAIVEDLVSHWRLSTSDGRGKIGHSAAS